MIYFLQREDGAIKIGTTTNYHNRLTALQRKHGPLVLLGLMEGGWNEEQVLHQRFRQERLYPDNEWFSPSDNLKEYIGAHARVLPPLRKSHLRMRQESNIDTGLRTNLIQLMAQKQLAEKRIITQAIIAEDLDITPATVNRWVHGHLDRFDVPTLKKLCQYFNCNVGDLLYFESLED